MKPGWINRQFVRVERDYQTWPDWMRRETEKRIAAERAWGTTGASRQKQLDRETIRKDFERSVMRWVEEEEKGE